MESKKVRVFITISILVLLFIGILVFSLIYVADIGGSGREPSSRQSLEPNSSRVVGEDTNENENKKDNDSHHVHTTKTTGTTVSTTREPVTTETQTTETMTTGIPIDTEYTILLNKNASASSGFVYIAHGDVTGFVCTDGFDNNDAMVVCRELGFEHGVAYNNRHYMEHNPYTRYTLDQPMLSLLECTGSEQKLSECNGFRLDNDTECTWFTGVVCHNEEEPYELRLVNGYYPDSGLVEIKLDGEWGLFCAIHTFDDEVADILCRNMNYTGGLTIPRGELGSASTDKIWVPLIYCKSEIDIKESIFECSVTLHTDNILLDQVEFRNNRYRYEYMACSGEDSFAASVQCLK